MPVPVAHVVAIDGVRDFLELGIRHILGGPDHILFVLSLLLVFESLKELLRITLTFTAAHSLTLLLAGSGTLTVAAAVVEPIIAFSISIVAIGTVFFGDNRFVATRWAKLTVVALFGFFHGLGFAGLLRDTTVPDHEFVASLVAFNIGIEIGQLVIVAFAVPLLLSLRRAQRYTELIQSAAVFLGAIGVLWGCQRIIG